MRDVASFSFLMENAMPSPDSQQNSYSTVEFVLNSIANWVNKYRETIAHRNELGRCGPDEVMLIAKDPGVSPKQLREFVRKGPGAADMLQKMLVALNVDPKALANIDPVVMRNLQQVCITCDDKKLCKHELANGAAAEHFRDFCPNAFTLDALFDQKDRMPWS
jgi:hypothetical protein